MKKLLFVILFFSTSPLMAQWNVGLKGGVNITWMNYDARFNQDNVEQEFKMGSMGGLTFQYFNQPNIGIQMDVLYIQKGFKTKLDTVENIQYERTIDYLSIPLLMHAYIGKKKFNMSIMLGPYISYALTSNEIYTENDISDKEDYVWNRDIDNRFEFGLQAGLAFRNTFSFGIIQLEGMYCFGLTSIYKWGAVNSDPDKDIFFPIPEQLQNQGIQITLSYYRSLGKTREKK